MEPTHVHLLLNHYPIFATIIGFAILLFGIIKNNPSARIISYTIFISAALVSILVFQSGEGAEDIIEKIIPSSERYIEAHEEAADIALWFAIDLCSSSITNIASDQLIFVSFIWLGLLGLNPADCILNPFSRMYIASAVLLSLLFLLQTTNMFGVLFIKLIFVLIHQEFYLPYSSILSNH